MITRDRDRVGDAMQAPGRLLHGDKSLYDGRASMREFSEDDDRNLDRMIEEVESAEPVVDRLTHNAMARVIAEWVDTAELEVSTEARLQAGDLAAVREVREWAAASTTWADLADHRRDELTVAVLAYRSSIREVARRLVGTL